MINPRLSNNKGVSNKGDYSDVRLTEPAHAASLYGCDWVKVEYFNRLAQQSVTFDCSYAGSLPCIPARQELHTGRYNFLHCSWEIVRGQEGDYWKGQVRDPEHPEDIGRGWRQDWVNRQYIQREEQMCQACNFALGLEFIQKNHWEDNWFLQIETFDPHEPFFTQQSWKDLYPHDYSGPHFDWPPYQRLKENPEQVRHCWFQYAALLSMCDHYLGRVLQAMDDLDLWKDTLLIVNTDHGHLLGEHGWLANCIQPFYEEVSHTPLFIWDSRTQKAGERRASLVQTIDLAPTLLEFFTVSIPKDILGIPLAATISGDAFVRQAAIFGMHSLRMNVTDGRYVYMRATVHMDTCPVYNYTIMPIHIRMMFPVEQLQDITLSEPFDFSKGCRLLKVKAPQGISVSGVRGQEYREGLPVTIVCPSYDYGKTWIPSTVGGRDYTVVNRIRQGKKIIVHGDSQQLWTMTHNSDFAKGLVGLLGNVQAIGESLHVTSDEVLTWDQIYQAIERAAGVTPKLIHIASEFINAVVSQWGKFLFDDKACTMVFDNSKIKRVVEEFMAMVPFAQGVRRSVEWFDAEVKT
jgi:arylsulfatase A-like enzyme